MSLCRWIRERFPEIDMDLGTAVHFLYGYLSAVLGGAVGSLAFVMGLFTFIFCLKQLFDLYGGEVPSGQIVGLLQIGVCGLA